MYLNYRLFILFFFSEIGLAFNTLGKDPDCRVIILSGNGKAFCSGIDLKDLMDVGNIINSDEDTARKSLKLFNIVKDYQNWFMEMEKVGIYGLIKGPSLNPYITSADFWTFSDPPPHSHPTSG
jgi:hypothetical protein